MKEKQSLTRETCGRYRKSEKKGKTKILDEFCLATGYNRKYALHLLANWDKTEVLKVAGKMVKLKCPLLNYFLPTIKLINKTRVGSKVRKVYDKPMSPYQRLLLSADIPDTVKAELTRRYQRYNPVTLQQDVHQAVEALAELNRQKTLIRQQPLAAAALEDF
ncbi:hypothetical protein FACS189485_14710 [Spirochaetia bacterium]|nr:hypothetical protein FACS189485_14710 [Spirochaetia bacterium]